MNNYKKSTFRTDIQEALLKISRREDGENMTEENFAFMLFTIQKLMIKYNVDATNVARQLKKFRTYPKSAKILYSQNNITPDPIVVDKKRKV